jgi:hypothetical protein
MTITLHIHESWSDVPVALSRLMVALAALEKPRQAGDDGDDLTELLSGMDDAPEATAAAATPMAAPRPPAAATFSGEPRTGQAMYKFACNAKCLPRVNAYGKARGWHKLVTHWDAEQVAEAYRELTAEPAAATNGRTAR